MTAKKSIEHPYKLISNFHIFENKVLNGSIMVEFWSQGTAWNIQINKLFLVCIFCFITESKKFPIYALKFKYNGQKCFQFVEFLSYSQKETNRDTAWTKNVNLA